LYSAINYLETSTSAVSEEASKIFAQVLAENRLLNDLKELDSNNEFYYTATIDTNLAIEFNESNKELNTLMNPNTNYDINNINNSFVISKLDIDYLDRGIQIARSSRLN
jgi:hypothetical protein